MTEHHSHDHTDDGRVALLRRAADGVPVGPLHTDLLLATARRRRRQRWGAGLAAAAVLVVAGGTAALGLSHDERSPSRPDSPVSQSPPAAETRLVGVGRLAVEVPASWPSGKVQCGGPTVSEPTVFAGLAGRDCMVTDPAPYVAVVDHGYLPDGYDDGTGADLAPAEVPGGEVLVSEEPRTVRGLVTMQISHEPSGFLQVATRSEAETRAIVDSARILPADEIAVPWTPEAIEAAGLVVEEVPVDTGGEYSDGYVLGSQPGGGSVVAVGSTVRVRVARSTDWPSVAIGPAVSCVSVYPDGLAERAGAVAGTVTAVQVGRYDADAGASPATVTVAVDEWFRGGSGPTVVLHTFDFMLPDDPQDAVGTRILAAFGPTRDLMACGYTRPWDEKTALEWTSTFG